LLPIQEDEGEWRGGGGVRWSLTPEEEWPDVAATVDGRRRFTGQKDRARRGVREGRRRSSDRGIVTVCRWSVDATGVGGGEVSARSPVAGRWAGDGDETGEGECRVLRDRARGRAEW